MRQLSTKVFENSLKPALRLKFAAILQGLQKLDFTVKKWEIPRIRIDPNFDCLAQIPFDYPRDRS